MRDPATLKRDQWILVTNGVAQAAVIAWVFMQPWQHEIGFMTLAPVGRDFVNFWLGGHLALTGQTDLLVDWQGYNDLLRHLFGRRSEEMFFFSYAPNLLPFLVPFGAIPAVPSVLVWTGLNLACVWWTVRLFTPDRSVALAACLCPATLMMVAFGHFGGVLALVATFILLHGKTRPLIAGLGLGLMTVKPQLATVFGLFLLATGYWRAVLVSVPATLALIGISVAAFGLQPWVNFVEQTAPLHSRMITEFYYGSLMSVVSVYCGARLMGLSGLAANGLQGVFSVAVLAKSVRLFGRRGPDACGIAIVLFAAIAALPYFNCYDLAVFAPAMTVALFDPARRDDRSFLTLPAALLLWLAPVYAVPFGMQGWPVIQPILAALLLELLFRHDRRPAVSRSIPADDGSVLAEPQRVAPA